MSTVIYEAEVTVPVIVKVFIEDESYEVKSVKLAKPKAVMDAVYEQCDTDLGEVAQAEIDRMREEDDE